MPNLFGSSFRSPILDVLFAACAACSACGGTGQQVPGDGRLVVISYDPAFDAELLPDGRAEAEAVRDGAHFWNSLGANLQVVGDTNERPAATYYLARSTFSWPGVSTAGVTWPGCGSSTIYPNALKTEGVYDYTDLRDVVAHELGHAIGLFHVEGYAVMNARSPGFRENGPSNLDRAEYERVYPH